MGLGRFSFVPIAVSERDCDERLLKSPPVCAGRGSAGTRAAGGVWATAGADATGYTADWLSIYRLTDGPGERTARGRFPERPARGGLRRGPEPAHRVALRRARAASPIGSRAGATAR